MGNGNAGDTRCGRCESGQARPGQANLGRWRRRRLAAASVTTNHRGQEADEGKLRRLAKGKRTKEGKKRRRTQTSKE